MKIKYEKTCKKKKKKYSWNKIHSFSNVKLNWTNIVSKNYRDVKKKKTT